MKQKKEFVKSIRLFLYGNHLMIQASKRKYIGLIILSILGGVISPCTALVWERFLNRLVEVINNDCKLEKDIWMCLLLLSLLPIANYALNCILQYIKQTFSDKMDLFITTRIINKALGLSMRVYDDSTIYNDINMAITKTTQNCMGILDAVTEILFYLIQVGSYVAILFYFDWRIVIIAILAAIPSLCIAIKTNKYWYETLSKRIGKFRYVDYLKSLLIRNEFIKEVRLYNIGATILEYIKKTYNKFIVDDSKARRKFLSKKIFAQVIDEIFALLMKFWIIIRSIHTRSTVGAVVLYFNSQESLKSALTLLLGEIAKLQDNILYLQILDRVEKIEDFKEEENKKVMQSYNCIEFRDVSFTYPNQNRKALEHLNFSFECGKTYSIVGFNGAGKTTLLKLLLGLYEPDSGEVLIDGIPLREINKEQYYKHIGAVFQDFIKYPFSVAGNVSANIEDWDEERVDEAIQFACVDKLIEKLPNGINTTLLKDWNSGVDISQGQWQKIAIARCQYRKPDIMILDEPFSSIDIEAENNIVKNLKETCQKKLCIFITHHFSSISMADEVIVMESGKIIEMGKHMELLEKKGKYFQLYSEQLENLKKMQ